MSGFHTAPKSELFDNRTILLCPKSEQVRISGLYCNLNLFLATQNDCEFWCEMEDYAFQPLTQNKDRLYLVKICEREFMQETEESFFDGRGGTQQRSNFGTAIEIERGWDQVENDLWEGKLEPAVTGPLTGQFTKSRPEKVKIATKFNVLVLSNIC